MGLKLCKPIWNRKRTTQTIAIFLQNLKIGNLDERSVLKLRVAVCSKSLTSSWAQEKVKKRWLSHTVSWGHETAASPPFTEKKIMKYLTGQVRFGMV